MQRMRLDTENAHYVAGERADYLLFPGLNKYPELGAAFAIRGAKGYHYESSAKDANYAGIVAELGIAETSLIMPVQKHTANVAEYEDDVREYADTDGLIASRRGVTLCTKVADCISLLFYDPVKHAIGNVHSGWKGTLQKIGAKGVRKMVESYGTNPADLMCVICPSIRQDHFEVDRDVYDLFCYAFSQIIDEATQRKGTKYHIDTVRCNTWMLEQAGLRPENIIDSGICSVCRADLINSFRGNAEGEKSYRNLAMIWLRD